LLPATLLPVAALASPVDIVMQSSGTMYPSNPVLSVLGLDGVPDQLPQAYTLTIGALLDATAPGVLSEPQVSLFEQFKTQVDVSFQYGAQHYTYNGVGDVLIEAGSQYYERISIVVPGAPDTHIFAESEVQASGVATFPPLAPPAVGGADGAPAWQGASAVYVISGPFDAPTIISMSAQTQDVSVTATSPVPEPGSPAMLAAGLLVLLAPRPRRRQRK
jgi:MYXO-CTERM domain-containing protein